MRQELTPQEGKQLVTEHLENALRYVRDGDWEAVEDEMRLAQEAMDSIVYQVTFGEP